MHRGEGPDQSAAHIDGVRPRFGVERDVVASGGRAGVKNVDRHLAYLLNAEGISGRSNGENVTAGRTVDNNSVLRAVAAELEVDLPQHRRRQVVDGKRVAPAAAFDVGNFDAGNAQALRADAGGEARAIGTDGHLLGAVVGTVDVERIAAGLPVDRVVAVADGPVECIRTVAAEGERDDNDRGPDGRLAIAAQQGVLFAITINCIAAAAAKNDVSASTTMDRVGPAACRRLRGENDPGHGPGNLTQVAGNQILSIVSLDGVTAVTADEEIVASAALDHVGACPAVDGIAIVAAIDPIDTASFFHPGIAP